MCCFAGAFLCMANGDGISCRGICEYCLGSNFDDPGSSAISSNNITSIGTSCRTLIPPRRRCLSSNRERKPQGMIVTNSWFPHLRERYLLVLKQPICMALGDMQHVIAHLHYSVFLNATWDERD